jgi:hypothetical protein
MTDDVSKLKEEILTLRKDRDAWADLASKQSTLLINMTAELLELRKLHAIVDKLHRDRSANRHGEDWDGDRSGGSAHDYETTRPRSATIARRPTCWSATPCARSSSRNTPPC